MLPSSGKVKSVKKEEERALLLLTHGTEDPQIWLCLLHMALFSSEHNSILSTAWTSQVLSTLKATNSSANPHLLQAALKSGNKVVAERYSVQTDKLFTNSYVLISARLYIHMQRHIAHICTQTHNNETAGMFSLSEPGWSIKTSVQIQTVVSHYLQWSLLFRLYPLRSLLISLNMLQKLATIAKQKDRLVKISSSSSKSYSRRETAGNRNTDKAPQCFWT